MNFQHVHFLRASLNDNNLRAGIHQLFGTKVHVTGATPEEFLAAIGQYATGSPKYENGQAPPSLWPIVSEIVISHRSNALSTGAVLVDLPGVADSNAARNEVCKRFIQKSDYLWFVVDIVRAADNEMILSLLFEFGIALWDLTCPLQNFSTKHYGIN